METAAGAAGAPDGPMASVMAGLDEAFWVNKIPPRCPPAALPLVGPQRTEQGFMTYSYPPVYPAPDGLPPGWFYAQGKQAQVNFM